MDTLSYINTLSFVLGSRATLKQAAVISHIDSGTLTTTNDFRLLYQKESSHFYTILRNLEDDGLIEIGGYTKVLKSTELGWSRKRCPYYRTTDFFRYLMIVYKPKNFLTREQLKQIRKDYEYIGGSR